MKAGRLHTSGREAADAGTNQSVMLNAVTFQMTWPGAPVVYYGDEAGLTGWTDPDNRRTYPWGKENKILLEYHRASIHMRKTYKALRNGSLQYLRLDHGVLSYGRWDENDVIVVAINNNPFEREIMVPVWKAGATEGDMLSVIKTYGDGYELTDEKYSISNGQIKIIMPKWSSQIFVRQK